MQSSFGSPSGTVGERWAHVIIEGCTASCLWLAVPPLVLPVRRQPSLRVGITPRELAEGPQSFRVHHEEVRAFVQVPKRDLWNPQQR